MYRNQTKSKIKDKKDPDCDNHSAASQDSSYNRDKVKSMINRKKDDRQQAAKKQSKRSVDKKSKGFETIKKKENRTHGDLKLSYGDDMYSFDGISFQSIGNMLTDESSIDEELDRCIQEDVEREYEEAKKENNYISSESEPAASEEDGEEKNVNEVKEASDSDWNEYCNGGGDGVGKTDEEKYNELIEQYKLEYENMEYFQQQPDLGRTEIEEIGDNKDDNERENINEDMKDKEYPEAIRLEQEYSDEQETQEIKNNDNELHTHEAFNEEDQQNGSHEKFTEDQYENEKLYKTIAEEDRIEEELEDERSEELHKRIQILNETIAKLKSELTEARNAVDEEKKATKLPGHACNLSEPCSVAAQLEELLRQRREAAAASYREGLQQVEKMVSQEISRLEEDMNKLKPLNKLAADWELTQDPRLKSITYRHDYMLVASDLTINIPQELKSFFNAGFREMKEITEFKDIAAM